MASYIFCTFVISHKLPMRTTRVKLTTLSFFICFCFASHSQDKETINLTTKIESAGIFSDGDNAPFWLINNNYGIGSINENNQYLRASVIGDKMISDRWSISAGADIVGANNFESNFYIQQLFADMKYRDLFVSVGMKEREVPFKNMRLYSGSMTLSNNARPIPQIEAGFSDFVTIPYTNNLVQIKGGISYGFFPDNKYKVKHAGDGNYAKNVLYHRKYAFFKFEKNSPWSFIFGLEMDTQFGGDFYKKGKYVYDSPTKFMDFMRVLVPMSGGSDSNDADKVNIAGNVYGSWHFIFNYQKEKYAIKAYHEHFFEDHSGLFFKNMPDGIYGFEFNLKKKAPLSSVLFEWVYTKNQSGPFLWDKTPNIPIQVSDGDNYYNHVDYISLSNYGYTLGNPLMTSPIYNDDKTLLIRNARIVAYHLGLGGDITNDLRYRLLLTHSQSWGTSFIPSRNIRNQFSSLLEVDYRPSKLKGWTFGGALAYDDSPVVGNNLGFQLKLSKTFNSKF